MIIGSVGVDRPIHWIVGQSQEVAVPLGSLQGWKFVHPYLRLGLPRAGDQTTLLSDGALHLSCMTLSFVVPDENHQELQSGAEAFLRYLRLATKQAGLPTEVATTCFSSVDSLPEIDVPEDSSGFTLKAGLRETAVTLDHVSSAVFTVDFQIPVYAAMLLDAIDASNRDDHRAAILYAAIAIEVLANTRIEEGFEAARCQKPAPSRLRVIEVSSGGSTQRVDPIYSLLRKNARRSFGTLFYQLPLYVLGRSLHTDDPALYNEALRLYETRNQISHSGAEDPSSRALPVDRSGASSAVNCAARVFTWFGESGWR